MFIGDGEIRPFKSKVWLSSPTMHGEELKYMTKAYETNWMSTVGENINEVEAHLYGTLGKIDEIKDICEQNHAVIMEDAAESPGASYKGVQTETSGLYSAISLNGNNVFETES